MSYNCLLVGFTLLIWCIFALRIVKPCNLVHTNQPYLFKELTLVTFFLSPLDVSKLKVTVSHNSIGTPAFSWSMAAWYCFVFFYYEPFSMLCKQYIVRFLLFYSVSLIIRFCFCRVGREVRSRALLMLSMHSTTELQSQP